MHRIFGIFWSDRYDHFEGSHLAAAIDSSSLSPSSASSSFSSNTKSSAFHALHYLRRLCSHPKLILTPEHPCTAPPCFLLPSLPLPEKRQLHVCVHKFWSHSYKPRQQFITREGSEALLGEIKDITEITHAPKLVAIKYITLTLYS